VRWPDGGLTVGVRSDNTLRYYDESGLWERSVGGTGDGPGEFRQLAGLARVGGSVVAYGLQQPVGTFDRVGRFEGGFQPASFPLTIQGVFEDGSVLARGPQPRGELSSQPAPPGRRIQHNSIARGHPDGAVDVLGEFPNHETFTVDGVPSMVRYRPNSAVVAITAAGFYYSWPVDYDIEYYDQSGALERRIQRDWIPTEVTAEQRDSVRSALLADAARASEPQRSRWRALAGAMEFADTMPAHGRLVVDADDNLWVELPLAPEADGETGERLWDVFAPSGVWLGQVRVPGDFTVLDIGSDHVAGVARDAYGTEWVQVYALIRN
jgi:hypothetical protein